MICGEILKYGGRGVSTFEKHLQTKKHYHHIKLTLSNTKLSFGQKIQPYGSLPIQNKSIVQRGDLSEKPKPVGLNDRVYNMQAMMVGTLAENSLPLSMAPKLAKLAKALAIDREALEGITTMDRTHASYKLNLGLAKTFHSRTIINLKNNFFSLNIDESGSFNNKKILTILVSYFSHKENSILVEHLQSMSLIKVDAESIYKEITNLFKMNEIPWNNLVSILMDSCAVMRGTKTGLETRIRGSVAEHLLDINGDACHHFHNAAKKFCSPFQNHVEVLYYSLYDHFKWSTDLRCHLEEICRIMGVKFTMPERFISHRWLSAYDLAISTLRLYDAYFIFCFAYLTSQDKVLYEEILREIYEFRIITAEEQKKIMKIHKKIKDKTLTEKGKKRRDRLVELIIHQSQKTKLIMYFYTATLSVFKEYVKRFQTKTPLVHKINDDQEKAFREFLAFFLKTSFTNEMNSNDLSNFDIEDKKYHLSDKDIHFGGNATKIMEKMESKHPTLIWFKSKAKKAFLDTAVYLQNKLPINNRVLKALSAIDPIIRNEHALQGLRKLPTLAKNILEDSELEQYGNEVTKYTSDTTLPSYEEPSESMKDKSSITRLDKWWAEVKATGRYEKLSKMVLALMSCFSGPLVEGSFNLMKHILDSNRYSMSMITYNSYLTVQYYFQSRNTDSVSMFKRENIKYGAIDKEICVNIKKSASEYKKLKERCDKEDEKANPSLQSKKAARLALIQSEHEAKLAHEKSLKRKAMKQKLMQMVVKKAKKGSIKEI